MKRQLAFALVSAATLAVVPAFADSESTTTTTTTATATAAPVEASGEKEFGDMGTINFGAATALGVNSTSYKQSGNDAGKQTSFGLQVEGAYFVVQGLSIGAGVGYSSVTNKDQNGNETDATTSFNIGPRVGYNVWLSPPLLSLWPQVSLDYRHESLTVKGNDAGSGAIVSLGAWVPLLIHPVKHFHFGIGPYVSFDVSSSTKDTAGNSTDGPKGTSIGLKGEIAGWL